MDLDIESQEETKADGIEKLYKFKVAKRFKLILFAIFILELANGFVLCLFLYLLSTSTTVFVKIIILNNVTRHLTHF